VPVLESASRLVRVVIALAAAAACADPHPRSLAAPPPGPRGAARVDWTLRCGSAPCSCAQVGASDVELTARGPGAPYVEHFECEQQLAVTADLPVGRYTIELRAEDDDGAVLGAGATAGAIGDDLSDLGTVEIAIGG
jgi:hypothetical protein